MKLEAIYLAENPYLTVMLHVCVARLPGLSFHLPVVAFLRSSHRRQSCRRCWATVQTHTHSHHHHYHLNTHHHQSAALGAMQDVPFKCPVPDWTQDKDNDCEASCS